MASDIDPRVLLRRQSRRQRTTLAVSIILGMVLVMGLSGAFLFSSLPGAAPSHTADPQMAAAMAALAEQVNPSEGYVLPVAFGQLGPGLLSAGAIDLDRFIQMYRQAGQPLTEAQQALLQKGSADKVSIDAKDAFFLLNFFWAVGLVNANPVLTKGEMMAGGIDKVGNFASTGGWTLGTRAPTDLYASILLIPLTQAQQARLESVARAVYRPCCDNSTHFPDCNHGMAMLGLLELMASQDASEETMFETAKYVNAYWYPQQMQEVAAFFKANQKVDFAVAEARQVVSLDVSSSTGFRRIHSWLASNGLLPETSASGGSCGVQ